MFARCLSQFNLIDDGLRPITLRGYRHHLFNSSLLDVECKCNLRFAHF
jgi:hypothetical protein